MFVASCVHCLILKLVYSKQEAEVNTFQSKHGIIWTNRFWIQHQSFRFVMLALHAAAKFAFLVFNIVPRRTGYIETFGRV